MIQLTPAAARHIDSILKQKDQDFLRIGVTGGGCSGMSYTLAVDDQPGKYDQVVEQHGVKLIIDRKSALYLQGMVLDYEEDLMGAGFKFDNPNARRKCHCGTSFGV